MYIITKFQIDICDLLISNLYYCVVSLDLGHVKLLEYTARNHEVLCFSIFFVKTLLISVFIYFKVRLYFFGLIRERVVYT